MQVIVWNKKQCPSPICFPLVVNSIGIALKKQGRDWDGKMGRTNGRTLIQDKWDALRNERES